MRAARAHDEPGRALSIDWLLGLGSYAFACGAASGAIVRNGYAHLMPSTSSGGGVASLRALDARLTLGPRTYALDGSRATADRGVPTAEALSFASDPWPRWRWRVDGVVIEKALVPIAGYPALLAIYRHLEGPRARLVVSPVVDTGAPEVDPAAEAPAVQTIPGRLRLVMSGTTLTLWHGGAFLPLMATRATIVPDADGLVGLPRARPAWVPGLIEVALEPGEATYVIASAENDLFRALAREDRLGSPPPRSLAECAALIEAGERARLRRDDAEARAAAGRTARKATESRHPGVVIDPDRVVFGEDDPWIGPLARAVRLGAQTRDGRESVVASLPFGDEQGAAALRTVRAWITLDERERARDLLCRYGQLVRHGLVPSGFDRDGRPRAPGVEASLWLVVATEHVARRTDDHEFVRRALYPSLEHVVEAIRGGRAAGVRVAADALLEVDGPEGPTQPTDLNLLWYQAQVAIGQLARALGHKEQGAFSLASARDHQARLNEALWDESAGCLYHARDARGPVRGMEPTQLLAALSPAALPPDRAKRLIQTVERELFTVWGLREAAGSPRVLPEWLGPFFTAYLRAHGRADAAQDRVRHWMRALGERLVFGACVHVPVTFTLGDGDEATVVGDSVSVVASAELLRAWVEELDHVPVPAADATTA